jgi:hypothetical protein
MSNQILQEIQTKYKTVSEKDLVIILCGVLSQEREKCEILRKRLSSQVRMK